MELLKKLCLTCAPSGREEAIRALISEEIRPYVDSIKTDAMGNLIAHVAGPGKRVMFAAHMDEIGVIATYIDDNGFVRFASVGWLPQFYALYRRVQFTNGAVGVIGYEEELAELKELKADKLYIDLGVSTKAEAEALISIGDMACIDGGFSAIGSRVTAKAMDNRAGCWALIRAIQSRPKTDNDLYYVFTVQEEVGLRGAKAAGFSVDPEYALAIDVCDSGDTPACHPMAVELGKGAAVKIKDSSVIAHHQVREALCTFADSAGIPYQLEIMTAGGTDAGAIQLARGGVKTGGISIPTRYIHSAVELVDFKDLQAAAALAARFACI